MNSFESKSISRRELLLGTSKLAGVAATVGLTGMPIAGNAGTSDAQWDHETDVVSVGSGAAAMTAAVTARSQGVEVMVLEKMSIMGGTTGNKSGAVAWIPNNSLLRVQGIDDKKEDCLRLMARYAYPQIYTPNSTTLGLSEKAFRLLEAFYDNGWRMIDFLQELGVLKFKQVTTYQADKLATDYADHLPENKVPNGRSIEPAGGAKGGLGGQAIVDYGLAGGANFTARMQEWLTDHQVPILTEHRVTKILKNGKTVTGVEVENNGKLIRIKARRAVIFGTGGYAHNLELIAKHQTALYGSCAMPSATGDFIPLAADAGAAMGTLGLAWRSQVVLEDALKSHVQAFTIFVVPGDSMILVNKYGDRVVNEKRCYNDRTRVHFTYDPTREEYPNQLLFQIFDERSLDAFGGNYPFPMDRRESRALIQGETLEELANNITQHLKRIADKTGGVALAESFKARLNTTIKHFNEYARSGNDLEFGRGEHAYDRDWHQAMSAVRKGTKQPANKLPNITMYPLASKGPYYAIIFAAGALDTCGGPQINEAAQLVGNDGNPIPGLYGAGNCISSPTNGTYFGAGGTIGPAMTFGFIAGLHAAKRDVGSA